MQNSNFDSNMVTTTFKLHGYKVTEDLGVVKGIIVRSRSIVGNLGAGLQTIFGGNITIYTNMCEKARDDTYNLMCEHAKSFGANGIIGMRYDTNEISQGISEVLCYGTAVKVKKV
ncbi:MAG: YbjQ family protein [Patescibacteria group bacterium]